jgi:hypothetical protein
MCIPVLPAAADNHRAFVDHDPASWVRKLKASAILFD